jgi:hypothetical protein
MPEIFKNRGLPEEMFEKSTLMNIYHFAPFLVNNDCRKNFNNIGIYGKG